MAPAAATMKNTAGKPAPNMTAPAWASSFRSCVRATGRRVRASVGHASEPACAFVAHVAERAPSVVVRVLAPGESVALADA